ncbi:MAG TPA: SusC/RagA family TonB-linked outer membrane protein [Gemmatimonadaceae bacterium]|nr:SusC/RagA family TonB-linked outer membrane protein [Gemmatimonadaceae bacterium]
MLGSRLQRGMGTAAIALAGLLVAGVASAQNVEFSGKVTSEAGQPLAGANVGITELGVGSVAGPDGRYAFTVDQSKLRNRTLNVTARFIGYKPKRLPVTITGNRFDHDFVLARDVLNLEEVVVTGTSAATEQKKTPFTVNVVDNTEIKEAPAVSPIASLDGKIPGASVVSTSGQPGSEPSIRLRSATSLTGRQDPLVIIDGTITRLGLADINSEDIERVEVIKGAAASSLYGSDAANGVIQIFTKRGVNLGEGQTNFTIRNELGSDELPKLIEGNMHHNYEIDTDASGKVEFKRNANGDRVPKADGIADNPYPVYYDQWRKVFRPGQFMTNYVSAGQRRGSTNFNASFQNTHDNGVLALLHGFHRQNFRLNVDHSLTDKIDLEMGSFYGRSTADQGEAAGQFFGMRFLEPNVKIDSIITTGPFAGKYNPAIKQPPLSGNVVNPLYALQQLQVTNNRDRYTGTFKTIYRPATWFTFDGNLGYDEAGDAYKSYTPLGYANSAGVSGKGGLFEQSSSNRSYNVGLTATATGSMGVIHNTTKAAFVYEDQTNQLVNVNAPQLTVPNVPEFTAAAKDPNNPVSPGSLTQTIRARNEFLVSTFDIKDRYILDGLIRRDESSLFGADERTQYYQRISGAWRVSQDLRIPKVDELKLRVSHGTAGLRPPFEAQYEAFALVAGAPEPVVLGNKKLKPAFSRESEYGFDLNFLTNYSFEYTYSQKRTTDEIIKVPLSAAAGYQVQWQNAGTLEGHSHEAALNTVLLSKADYFWRVGLTGDRTRQKIADLKVGAFLIGPSEGTTNTQIFRVAKGEPLGVIYGSKWIKNQAELEQTIKTGRLTGTAADYVQNEEGFYVRKTQYHTKAEVPLKAYYCADTDCKTNKSVVQIGDVNPDFNLGLNNSFTWKAISINGTVTWTKGGQIYNYTRQWPFNELRDKVIDQSGKPAASCTGSSDASCPYSTGKKPTTYYSTFYNNFDPNDYFVENGSYARLRELSVNWQLPSKWAEKIPVANFRSARLGIVGRNLWTKTKYSGYDPDVTGPGGGNPFAYRVDYFTYPAYRTFTGVLELGF